uniref:uncharacterized protein LOC120339518 n=1 Tax=Styela clava TaxID=7725 RepID=UPI00193A24E3|nr:uncharacterized protein LOC120339518 [Styela clava]
METFKLLFMCVGFATTVDISVKVEFRGSAVMTPYRHEETITAKNEHELREKLAKTLENALLDKQIDEVTITTEVYHGNKVHSTQVTKFDATTPTGLDDTTLVTTSKGNDITEAVTSSATRSTTEVHDVTTATVVENVFTTRSITPIASTKSFQQSILTANTGKCGFTYKSKCFRAIVYDEWKVTLDVAESICDHNLANIYDATYLNLLKDYLRTIIPDGWSAIAVRTGMTFKNGNLYLTNDTEVSFPTEVWHPFAYASYTNVVLEVERNTESKPVIYNVSPSHTYRGAICENEL